MDAERLYLEILQQRPNHVDALHLLGVIAVQTQRTQQGIELIKKSVRLNARIPSAHNNLANALLIEKRPKEALASYNKAIALKPDDAGAYYNRGNALRDLKRLKEAIVSYDKAIALKPDYVDAYNNRGNVLRELKRPGEALESFDKAIALRPDYAEAHNNRGAVLRDLGRPGESLANCEKAIALKSDYADAYNNRGNALRELRRPEEAVTCYNRAIALKRDDASAYYNRGNTLLDLKRPEEAIADFDMAIALKPEYASAHWNQSHCFLQMGLFEQGWRQYEWRKKCDEPIAARSYPKPLWLGEGDIAGKTLFVHWEQGFGDAIQFCRYAKFLEDRGAKVIMSVQEPLRELLKQFSPTIQILRPNETPTDFDFHCPLLSLPLALGTTLETIPAEHHYLRADDDLRSGWSARLSTKVKPRIGMVWSGSSSHENDRNRSIGPEQFLSICDLDAHWISLQKEFREGDLAAVKQFDRITVFGDDLRDFNDTAALLDLMDLVITIDTSVAHLAGAMGKPVWVLLPFNPDWRWMLDRNDSPWYPSARLFRQQQIGNWAAVIDQVKRELELSHWKL